MSKLVSITFHLLSVILALGSLVVTIKVLLLFTSGEPISKLALSLIPAFYFYVLSHASGFVANRF